MAIYLSLGSNLGDRAETLRAAIDLLKSTPDVEVILQSRIYETAPAGVAEQPAFLNMVVSVKTTLSPLALLDCIQAIEQKLGRVRTQHWGPRVIDIDIVLWDELVYRDERLTIPHPELVNRAFVLTPLAEIAPDAIEPVTKKAVSVLAARDGLQGSVMRVLPD